MPTLATRCIACDHAVLERQSAVLMPFVAQRALGWTACEITADWGLHSIPLGHAQALCSTLHCPRCGMLFLDMRFDDAEMARLYAGYRDAAYSAERERFEPGYAQRNTRLVAGDDHIAEVEAFLRPWLPARPRILDWGGDTGLNTPLAAVAARHLVFDISGRPPVPGAQRVDLATATAQCHDLVVLSNVLEHAPWPLALLQQLRPALRDGARLYLELPLEALMREAETDSSAWRRKRHWHEHVNFFSSAALACLTERAGLEVLARQVISLPDGATQLALVCRDAR